MAKKPTEYVEIEIDDQLVSLPRDQVILWSARALGFDIPHFCAHRWLEPYGACRMCLAKVEMGGRMMPKLQTTCSLMPAEGMKIWTKHPEVIQVRREQLEFHLLNHPLECPVCDKGGECMLQDQTMDHGMQEGRYIEQKKARPDAMMNEYIRLNYKRCIHCKRCVNYTTDIDGSFFLQFVERGAETIIESFADPTEAPRFTGNVIDMCPVGALTARNYRFKMGRAWEQELAPSVGSLDSVGANIWLNGRLGDVARIVPRDNPDSENELIDDVTRFSWECIEDERRVTRAIERAGEGDGEETLSRLSGEEQAARRLQAVCGEHGPDSIGVIAGGGLNTEDYLALRAFCGRVLDTAYYHCGDDLLGPKGPDAAAVAVLGSRFGALSDVLGADTVLSLGCDLFDEAPSLGLRIDIAARRRELTMLSARGHGSDADRFASLFLDYGPGNLLRVVRGLTNALSGEGEVPPEVEELAQRLRAVGEDCAILVGQELWRSEDPLELLHALEALRGVIEINNPEAENVYLNPVYPAVNSVGAMVVNDLELLGGSSSNGTRPPAGSLGVILEAAASGKLKALLIADSDVLTCYPDRSLVERALSAIETFIYCGPFATPTSEAAHLHLPLGTWAHYDGTVLSMEWRMQKRSRASIDSVAPSLLDVLNSIAAAMDHDHLASDADELLADLARMIPGIPRTSLEAIPAEGVPLRLEGLPDSKVRIVNNLPAAVAGTAEFPLVVAPKRFLYNDRQEVRYSRVFDQVAKPFFAYVHPDELERLGLAEGDEVGLQSDSGEELTLPVKPASWVGRGSVVINDYYVKQPANRLAGAAPVRVALNKLAGVRED